MLRTYPAAVLAASCALAALAPAAGQEKPKGREQPWKWTAEMVLLQPRVIDAALSPDGTRIVYVRTRPRRADERPGGAYANLWMVAASETEPRRMTTADAVDSAPAWSPDGSWIAFGAARGEGAKRQIWILPADGGEAYPLTSEKSGVLAFKVSPDRKRIAYTAADEPGEAEERQEREGRDWTVKGANEKPVRVRVIDVESRKSAPLASAGDLTVHEFDWAPKGDALVANVADTPRTDDSYMGKRTVILPVAGGAAKTVAKLGGKIGEVAWSKDGATIAFLAAVDRSDPFQGSLFVVPAAGGDPKNLTEGYEGTIQKIEWRKDGKIVALAAEGTKSVVAAYDPASGAREVIEEKGPVVLTTISLAENGATFAGVGSSADHPNEVFVRRGPGGGLVRVTKTAPAVEALPRGRQETYTWTARDGLAIEGVLIHPAAGDARSRPLVVCVHGGPEAHEPDNWKTTDYIRIGQAAAERGWYCLYPNYRASTGRGVKFGKMDHGDLGGKEFDDVVDGVDALVKDGRVDPKRVGAIGGSYGGYFTAWAVTKLSDRFAAGVENFGIADWLSFMGQTDIPVENESVHMARPFYDNMELYWDRSPIRWIKNARTPTLVLQGGADDRVPKPQSDELWQGLRRNGVPVEYVVYPREPHGYRERAHIVDAFDRSMAWFEKYLGAAPRP